MDCYFSIVLYKTPEEDIKNIINSIQNFKLSEYSTKFNDLNINILFFDNYNLSNYGLIFKNNFININYSKSDINLGYGKAHNKNFTNIKNKKKFLFITLNPDISFNPKNIYPLFDYAINKKDKYSCLAPLIILNDNKVQYSAKKNPTILDLIISRFVFLHKITFLKKRFHYYINYHRDYFKEIIPSPYLSGCFILFPSDIYKKIGGFSPEYFLHLEDADITRKCSLIGKCLHIPTAKINHKRGRGSHNSIVQQFHLVRSIFIYFRKWGIALF